MPKLPVIELPPLPLSERPPVDFPWPKPKDPGGGCEKPQPRSAFDDTTEPQYTPFIGPAHTVLDTGRRGPDQVDVTINRDGSSWVTVNGQRHSYSAEETRNLHVPVDVNDTVNITDNRSPMQKALSPNPIEVFTDPR